MFFFFQAEDCILDIGVTGVQTWALPISSISDFENGKTNLSNDVLLQLLGFMIVEINELFEWEDFHEKELIEAIKQIELAIKSKHIPALSQLQQDFQSLSKTKGQYIYHIISLILTITIAEYQDKKIDPHIMSELTDYFFSLERSEEHTSELQSRQYLVCRLLLEK